MPLVFSPASDRAGKEGLANLPKARSEDRPLCFMKFEASGLPVETEEFDQPPALCFQVGYQLLVVDHQHLQRQHAQPMLRQPVHLQKPPPAIGQIMGEHLSLVKLMEIAG